MIITNGSLIYDDELATLMKQYTDTRYLTFVYRKKPKGKDVKTDGLGDVMEENENSMLFSVKSENVSDLIAHQMETYNILDVDITSPPFDEMITQIFQEEG